MKKILFVLSVFCVLFFTGCDSSVKLTLNSDNSVDLNCDASIGTAFTSIYTLLTQDTSPVFFDAKSITKELTTDGFTNVNSISKTGTDINVKAKAPYGKTTLFTSGLIKTENKKIKLLLSPKQLQALYKKADEQTKNFLDLLMAPVFTDEELSEEEYLDLVSSMYGIKIQEEIANCVLKLEINNADGTKATKKLPLITLLTLNKEIEL